MFNIGPGELIVILIVALVFLGPDKLPEMARTVGKGMRELRKATEDLKDQVENEMYDLDPTKPRSPILKAPPGPRAAQIAHPSLPAPERATTIVPPVGPRMDQPAVAAEPIATLPVVGSTANEVVPVSNPTPVTPPKTPEEKS